MKYAVLKCVNGNYSIHSEGFTEISKAMVSYHGLCQSLWNTDDVETADIMLIDERLFKVRDCYEHIDKNEKPATTQNFPI
jgi:hypothetical protein